MAGRRRGRYCRASGGLAGTRGRVTRFPETSSSRVTARAKKLALVAWVPIVIGAILAAYGDAAWNQLGVAVWTIGLALQFVSLVLFLRPRRQTVP